MINSNRTRSIVVSCQLSAAGECRVSGQSSRVRGARRFAGRGGFTLIELLVVILIIALVSAVALPVVLPALSHRQVSEAARILQGALVGARDSALHNGTPSGIRLLPDPAFPLIYLPSGQIDPTQPFAANRIIPIESAPEYSSGMLSVVIPMLNDQANLGTNDYTLSVPYPAVNGGGFYPSGVNSATNGNTNNTTGNVLMVKEIVAHNNLLNEPTSWFWNIRVGDKLQINDSGLWYTVVGPMVIPPQGATINGVSYGNSELFVNAGPPGSGSPLQDMQSGALVNPEFLYLVNGLDDNNNGWIDEGYDGIDNNRNQETNNVFIDDLFEWEVEAWPSTVLAIALANPNNPYAYSIQRRPAPTATAREVLLPTNVVIDMTTWNNSNLYNTPAERSQFPPGVINPYTGYVDILLNPNGTVVPTTLYSTPSSFGMLGAFFHFWLAERSDVVPMNFGPNNLPVPQVTNQHVYLPIGNINQELVVSGNPYTGQSLKGEYRIVTLFARTGQVTTNDDAQFDNPMAPANTNTNMYNPGYPFLSAEQGSKGSR